MVASYERMFGQKPWTTYSSPLEKGDHPELDMSEELGEKGIQQYQSLIGSMQWAVSIGRLDITTAVMTLSGFRAAPRQGHLDRARRVYGYLAKMKDAVIRIRTDEPDYSGLPDQQFDWAYCTLFMVTSRRWSHRMRLNLLGSMSLCPTMSMPISSTIW